MNALLTLILSVFAVAVAADIVAEGVALLVKGFFRRNLAADVADGVVDAWRKMVKDA